MFRTQVLKIVLIGKALYLTLNQFVLRAFDMSEDEEEVPQQNHNMTFST